VVAVASPSRSVVLDEAVLSAGLLRALDPRGRADLSLASRIHELSPGAALFVPGSPADALYVVARGKLRLDGSADPRTAEPGDLCGWDAVVPGAVRSGAAHATEATSVLELPLAALRRGLTRSGADELLAREERRARLRAFRALLASTELGAALGPKELDRVVTESREESLSAGDALGGAGRDSAVAWLVVSGLVAVEQGARGYASRGQLVGLEGALGGTGPNAATALGDVLVLAVPARSLVELRGRHPEAMERELAAARRRTERQSRVLGALGGGAGPAAPLGRLETASSLLAIDVGACVDCGHCVRACADTHGTPRFVRHGERVTASVDGGAGLERRAYLLPNACQHCREAACLSECPTSALVRDARGAVEIRTELCTGCGACVSACPWDAVKLTPSGTGTTAVAAKCDLCSGRDGPECVLACPTGAIARVEPARDFMELRVALGGRHGKQRETSRIGPWLGRAATLPALAVALSLGAHAAAPTRFAAGLAGAALLLVLAAHGIVKRVPSARVAAGRALAWVFRERASLRPLVDLHSTLGVLSLSAILVHTGGRLGTGIAGALTLSYWVLVGTGAAGGVAYLLLPRRLARLEPGREPTPDAAELDRRLFSALSGGNDAVRALARAFLIPHAGSMAGALALLCSGRDPGDEERALTARVVRSLGGRASARLSNLDALVRAAVAIRAARAARFGRALLGAFVPVHLVLAALLVALLAVHAFGALR
jgi:Fe-S-cluster-containing dehydrogenase component/CRP-like cAMP-binding protein